MPRGSRAHALFSDPDGEAHTIGNGPVRGDAPGPPTLGATPDLGDENLPEAKIRVQAKSFVPSRASYNAAASCPIREALFQI
jgi:hypothetical protein